MKEFQRNAFDTYVFSLCYNIHCLVCRPLSLIFQDPLPLCEENTVCSKINALSYFIEERHYFSYVTCQCPNGQKCPKSPGKQTILVEDGLWYVLHYIFTPKSPGKQTILMDDGLW